MQKKYIMTAEDMIYKLYSFFNVNNNLDLADRMKTTPQTISNWKSRNSVNAIKKRCRELGIYSEIFGDLKLSLNENSKEEDKDNSVLSNYFIALQSVAIATNKEDELIEDIKNLMKKYIGE